MTAALAPAQILNVHVTYADTGEPVPHAALKVIGQPRAGRHGRRIRDRRRGTVPREFLPGRWHLQRLGLSPGRTALPHRPQAYRLAQRPLEQSGRPRLASWHRDPRQGHRGGLRQARPGSDCRLLLPRGTAEPGKAWASIPVPHPMARFNSGPRTPRVTSSSRAPTTITCSSPSATGQSIKVSRAAPGSMRMPTSCST